MIDYETAKLREECGRDHSSAPTWASSSILVCRRNEGVAVQGPPREPLGAPAKLQDTTYFLLPADLSSLRAEQRLLSPVNDFALYFKKDRAANKLQEQYDAAVRDRSSSAPSWWLLTPATMVVTNLAAMLILNTTTQPTAVCLPIAAFSPFNWLLRFPSVWSPLPESRCDELSTEVSLFVFLYLAVLFFKRAFNK